MDGVHPSPGDPPMPPASLPALPSGKPTAWEEAIYAFLVEKRSRSGSTRTVESYARMLWPFFRVTTPDQVRSADVLAYAHGIGASGRVPSSTTVGARVDEPRRDNSAHPRALSPRGRGRDPAWTEGERPDRLERPASLHRAVQDIGGEGGDDPAEVVLDRDSVVGTTALPYPGANGRTGEDGIDHEIPGSHHAGADEGQTDEVAAAPGRADRPSVHDQVGQDVARVDQHEPGEGDEDRDRAEPRAKRRRVVVRTEDEPRDHAGLLEDPGRDRCDRKEGQGQPHAQRDGRMPQAEEQEDDDQAVQAVQDHEQRDQPIKQPPQYAVVSEDG